MNKRYKALRDEVYRARDPRGRGRPVANNTSLILNDDDSIALRLHQTDVFTIEPDGTIELSTGGWYTMTTKDRISRWAPVQITSKKGVWYVVHDAAVHRELARIIRKHNVDPALIVRQSGGGYYCTDYELSREIGLSYWQVADRLMVPYFDGIRFGPGGKCLNGISPATWQKYLKDRNDMQKRIQAYCTGAHQWLCAEPREFPHLGDCWYCSMHTEDGAPLGDKTGDTTHLLDHLDEKYYMGALFYNALMAKGYRYPVIFLGYDQEAGTIGGEKYRPESRMGGSTARIALRDYLYDRLLPQPPTLKDDTENRPLRNNKRVCAF